MFIGIDVGGTKIAFADVDERGQGATQHTPTETGSSEALLNQIVELIAALRTESTRAVGIGVPSVIEFSTGRVRGSVNIPLEDLPLRKLLSERVGLPVYGENDASCAALAEAHDNGEMVCSNLVMFTVGTGVGGGLVLNGQLYRGATGAAGEIGHQLIGLDLRSGAPGADKSFPQLGSLEELASGSALDRLAEQVAKSEPDTALGKHFKTTGTVTGKDIVDAAHGDDRQAIEALRVLGERLGIGIANAINIFDPHEVVIGGGVSNAGELLLGPARRVAHEYALPGTGTITKIRLARHGVRAGVLGAALIAVQEFTASESTSVDGVPQRS